LVSEIWHGCLKLHKNIMLIAHHKKWHSYFTLWAAFEWVQMVIVYNYCTLFYVEQSTTLACTWCCSHVRNIARLGSGKTTLNQSCKIQSKCTSFSPNADQMQAPSFIAENMGTHFGNSLGHDKNKQI
jgi:hypothetical protein